jgi:hypothetical protein
MNEVGGYDGWIDYKITLTGSLQGRYNLKITGNFGRRQEIKEYLGDHFHYVFGCEIE